MKALFVAALLGGSATLAAAQDNPALDTDGLTPACAALARDLVRAGAEEAASAEAYAARVRPLAAKFDALCGSPTPPAYTEDGKLPDDGLPDLYDTGFEPVPAAQPPAQAPAPRVGLPNEGLPSFSDVVSEGAPAAPAAQPAEVLRKAGEADALRGAPMNRLYLDSLDYLRGYAAGQGRRGWPGGVR